MLIKHFIKAFMGRAIWNKLDRKHKADIYILMPKADEEYNYFALLYLDKYMESKHAQKAVILTCDEGVKKATALFKHERSAEIVDFSRKKALELIKYYALYEFSTKLTIISLTEPYDTCGENLLGVKGVTKKELLCFDIYRFSEVPNVKAPEYTGNDPDIKKIMSFANA